MAVFAPVLVCVLKQVHHDPRHERGVELDLNIVGHIRREAYAAAVLRHELLTAGERELADIPTTQGVFVGAVLYARHREQRLHKLRHMSTLLLNNGDGLEKIIRGLCLALCAVALGKDDGDGRSQLVRGVGGKLPLREEGLLKPAEHTVEGAAQQVQLLRPLCKPHAPREVAGVGYLVCGVDDALHRAKGAPCDEPAAAERYDYQRRQQRQRQHHYRVHQAGAVACRDNAAYPQPRYLHIDILVKDEIGVVFCLHRAHDVLLDRHMDVKALRRRAAQYVKIFVIEYTVNPALVGVKVVPFQFPVFKLHLRGVSLHDLDKTACGVVGDGVCVYDENEGQHQRCQKQHHQRYPQRDAHFCRHSSVLPQYPAGTPHGVDELL